MNYGKIAKDNERYLAAARRVQTAIEFKPNKTDMSPKQLRVGINMSKADAKGLATLLIAKGLFTLEEYIAAVAQSAEEEAAMHEDELSVEYGINITTL